MYVKDNKKTHEGGGAIGMWIDIEIKQIQKIMNKNNIKYQVNKIFYRGIGYLINSLFIIGIFLLLIFAIVIVLKIIQ